MFFEITFSNSYLLFTRTFLSPFSWWESHLEAIITKDVKEREKCINLLREQCLICVSQRDEVDWEGEERAAHLTWTSAGILIRSETFLGLTENLRNSERKESTQQLTICVSHLSIHPLPSLTPDRPKIPIFISTKSTGREEWKCLWLQFTLFSNTNLFASFISVSSLREKLSEMISFDASPRLHIFFLSFRLLFPIHRRFHLILFRSNIWKFTFHFRQDHRLLVFMVRWWLMFVNAKNQSEDNSTSSSIASFLLSSIPLCREQNAFFSILSFTTLVCSQLTYKTDNNNK